MSNMLIHTHSGAIHKYRFRMLPCRANVGSSSVLGIESRTPAPSFLNRLTSFPVVLGGMPVDGHFLRLRDFITVLAASYVSSRVC